MGIISKAKQAAVNTAAQTALGYLEKDPETNLPKLIALANRVCPDDYYTRQRAAATRLINEKGNWYQYILHVYEDIDVEVRKTIFQNLVINASLSGTSTQDTLSRDLDCNIPWAILMDPTSACNLHCTGCWAAEYGNKLNLTLDDLDSIINQARELGTYIFLYTGGEPLVRKKDLMELCRRHPDCEFISFTNGTLIDEDFCQELLKVKNFMPAISLEGFAEANDSRRGEGDYDAVMRAAALLKSHKLPFGYSVCYTSRNYADISSEEFFDHMIDSGAFFAWFFHYMPIGAGAVPELLTNPEQRAHVRDQIRGFRKTKQLFTLDFQNDAEYVDGCIAGGRRYLHINARGDVEPCAFIHYSNVNIHDVSLLDALKSPLFMAYHRGQPFNNNHLRPCPMLENPEKLRQMVHETGAYSTDVEAPEDVDVLCDRTTPYAENWKTKADELWQEHCEEEKKSS